MTTTTAGLLQLAFYICLIAAAHVPLGSYMARIAQGEKHTRVERLLYRVTGVDADTEQNWRHYARSVLGFSLAGLLLLYLLLRIQHWLPLTFGRENFPADGAFNTAVSFVTNTNWQWYSGEAAIGHLPQMLGLTVQNFVSGAVGISVAFALVRGFARMGTDKLGNFWVDVTRVSLRLLLPLAIVVATIFVCEGVIQSFAAGHQVTTLTGAQQDIPLGPIASQEAIKQLGTNGGGFFNANGAHPFENATALTNILAIWAMTVIPFSLPFTFGRMVRDRRQGFAILAVMATLQLASFGLAVAAELAHKGTALMAAGGAMEGKEQRFGIWGTVLYGTTGTGTSTGAVNSMHDSWTAAGGGILMLNMLLGEVSPGGVGTGLYGLLVIALLTVFISGLMVGRTPEYLGKRLGRAEMTSVALYILVMPMAMLFGAAITLMLPGGQATLQDAGPHGLSEILYAYTSGANNNGSAFAGFNAASPLHTVGVGLAMLFGRFLPIIFALKLAGSLAQQQRVPATAGTLPTHGPLFITLCLGIVLIVAALTFFPALALGPIAEALL